MVENLEYKLIIKDLANGNLKEVASNAKKTDKALESASKSAGGFGNAIKTAGAYLSARAVWDFGKDVLMTTARFQSLASAINTASETATQGKINFSWIADFSSKYGTEIESTADAFKTLRGSMINTKFTSTDTRRMFQQVASGAIALGLSAEDTKGTMLALGQMMGKGKVQAEELRGQLGERVPGAFSIAARAMKMTTAELDKFMSDGKLMSEEFLPKFAAEMEKTFGKDAEKSAHNLTNEMNRASNSWTSLLNTIGSSDSNGVMGKTLAAWSKSLDWFSDTVFKSFEQKIQGNILKRTGEALATLEDRTKAAELSGNGKDTKGKVKIIEDFSKKEMSSLSQMYKSVSLQVSTMQSQMLNKSGIKGNISAEDANKKIDYLLSTDRFSESTIKSYKALKEQQGTLKETIAGSRQFFDKKISDMYDPMNNKKTDIAGSVGSLTGNKSPSQTARTSDIKNITINIGKMIEDLKITVIDNKQIIPSIEREVKRVISLAVNDFNAIAN